MTSAKNCECAFCKHDLEFELDSFLIGEIRAGNCVIFAGAGVSTEGANSSPHTLYTELAVALNRGGPDLPFPDLAESYCGQRDGRFKLMQVIQSRFDYISKFRALRLESTKFHAELATMPYFKTFITTNWDRHFEELCGAKPFGYDADMRFWEVPDRRVLKIHGTIDDYSTIVATRSDYADCQARLESSLVGAKLKECLSTKTCIFIGYSLRDEDFREIYTFVSKALGKFSKQHYLVSPFPLADDLPPGVAQVVTDGTYFLKTIKQHMCGAECYLSDDVYDDVLDELGEVRRAHSELWDRLDVKKVPQMLASAFYQDGLIHAYQIIIDQRKTGHFSDLHRIEAQIHKYEEKVADYRARKKYGDVAYFRGYQNALLGLALSKECGKLQPPPRYYYESPGEMTRSQFYRHLRKLPEVHKASLRYFEKAASRLGDEMILQHPPWG